MGFILLLVSCGVTAHTRALIKGDIKVTVNVDRKANLNNPLAVDLVIVFDEDLLKQLLTYSAKTWFEKREQILRDFPNQEEIKIWNWEWTPGQNVSLKKVPMKGSAISGLVFANYFTKGDHRARFDPTHDVHIDLKETSFTVYEPE